MNKATKGLFPWLIKKAQDWKRFFSIKSEKNLQPEPINSQAKFRLPLKPDDSSEVRLALIPADLIRAKK